MVTQEVYKDLLLAKLLPMLVQKWLRRGCLSRKLFIQQDGVKNQISEKDRVFNEVWMEKEINGELYTQAANSPDVSILDLGFFRAIQSFNNAVPKPEDELIQVVSTAYMKVIHGTKSIIPGSPYNVTSTKKSRTMVAMMTILTIYLKKG